MTSEQKQFIEQIAPLIQKHAPAYGIKVCSPIIAQAILESAWGKSKLAAAYHNYFGMKCGSKWHGNSVNMTTSEEYTPGTHTVIKDNFRVYESMEEGVKGYFEFLQRDRYQNLRGITDPETYLETIKADEYATSSSYVKDLMKVIDTYNLSQYDTLEKDGDQKMSFKSEAAAIDAVLATAEAEVGYLEKKSPSNLDSKTGNAGSGNYTKYWRDVKPAYQGQYWCACFVSWVFMVVFGQAAAEKLLKHWPFVYCPTLAAKTSNKTPKRGSIVLFWKTSTGRYGHTGIVYKVTSTYIYTIEGNTSGASGVISNGGGVCKKKYKRSSLDSRTKFYMPDYSMLVKTNTTQENKAQEPAVNPIPGECDVTLKQLLPGANHNQVRAIQRILNSLGYKGSNGKALSVDGDFGAQTVHALKAFQAAAKLDLKTPGTVGAKTWSALLNAK